MGSVVNYRHRSVTLKDSTLRAIYQLLIAELQLPSAIQSFHPRFLDALTESVELDQFYDMDFDWMTDAEIVDLAALLRGTCEHIARVVSPDDVFGSLPGEIATELKNWKKTFIPRAFDGVRQIIRVLIPDEDLSGIVDATEARNNFRSDDGSEMSPRAKQYIWTFSHRVVRTPVNHSVACDKHASWRLFRDRFSGLRIDGNESRRLRTFAVTASPMQNPPLLLAIERSICSMYTNPEMLLFGVKGHTSNEIPLMISPSGVVYACPEEFPTAPVKSSIQKLVEELAFEEELARQFGNCLCCEVFMSCSKSLAKTLKCIKERCDRVDEASDSITEWYMGKQFAIRRICGNQFGRDRLMLYCIDREIAVAAASLLELSDSELDCRVIDFG